MTPALARRLQEEMREQVVRKGSVRPRLLAGVDASYREGRARGAIVVTRDLEPIEEATAELPLTFPYVPGLLSFRELPVVLAAWKKLRTRPEAVIVDGQGLAHPRRFGLASHLGVLLDLPTVGCAKSRLLGTYREPGVARGSWTPLRDRQETIGAALRTQSRTNVVYVSIGHRVSLRTALRIVLAAASRYRLPEPQRLADQLSKRSA